MSRLLHEYVTRQAERRPEAVALVMDDVRVTYGELEQESNRIACLLGELGCRRQDRVCLFLSKSPLAVAAMVAALKAGCSYVPVDISSPALRVEKIVRAIEPRAIIVDERAAGLVDEVIELGALMRQTALISTTHELLAAVGFNATATASDWMGMDANFVSRARSADEPAHILFTSGSTGVPKGVVITHSNVACFVEWAIDYFGTASTDKISGHPPLHFDLSTFDVYGTFCVGAELHLVPPRRSLLPSALAEFIRSAQLQQWFAVPSVFTMMAAFDALDEDDFPSLERVLWCGEVLPTPVLRYWMERVSHASFTNLYGPTETTIASSFFAVTRPPTSDTESVPIGIACGSEELHVLDERLMPVAAGEVGEIYIGGVGVSPGYWRDAERTRHAFVPDPGTTVPSTRLYRTGDLGRRNHDNLVYFLGRVDSQIKHRGHRIELGEIEVALNGLEQVRACAVVAIAAEGFEGAHICCAYVPALGAEDGVRELRNALRRSLPQYMLPSTWLRLGDLPTNANGKIDRPRLREMFEDACGVAAPRAARQPAAAPSPRAKV